MAVTPLRQPQAETETEAPDQVGDVKVKPARTFSSIGFPYADLGDALKVASTIRDKGGAPVSKDQLAPALGHAVSSGAFTAKISAARMFGLVQFIEEKIKLTDLGFEAIDSDDGRSKTAKVKAFLNVPLFEKTYTEFRNRQLPPRPVGLEQAFIGFGVISSRATNARWSFDRSAKTAGFFEAGEDRLVEPVIARRAAPAPALPAESQPEVPPPPPPPAKTDKTEIFSAGASEFLVKGLLDRMPIPGEEWTLAERARWLRALAVNLSVIYGEDDDGEIEIKAPAPKSKGLFGDALPAKPAPPVPKKVEDARPSMDMDDDIPF